MNGSVEVSVIVLAFNQAGLIGRALDSILAQNCDFGYEIVVADDASSDSTRLIAEGYVERFPGIVRLLPPAQRRGLVDNYFYALSQCRGRFIADCAADDYWLSADSLSRKFRMLVGNGHLSMVCSDWVTFENSAPDVFLPSKSVFSRSDNVVIDGRKLIGCELACCGGVAVHLSTVLYRRELLVDALERCREKVWNADFGCEDLPVKLALMARGDVAWLPEPTLAYCVGTASASAPGNVASVVDFQLKTAAAVVDLAGYYGIGRNVIEPNLKAKIGYAMSMAFGADDYTAFRKAEAARRMLAVRLPFKYWMMRLVLSLKCRCQNGAY